jgi:hypothetical protein
MAPANAGETNGSTTFAGMAADIKVIWIRREQEYFCKMGWTGDAPNSLSGKSGERTSE